MRVCLGSKFQYKCIKFLCFFALWEKHKLGNVVGIGPMCQYKYNTFTIREILLEYLFGMYADTNVYIRFILFSCGIMEGLARYK